MRKIARIFLDATPVIGMIALIPVISSDYVLAAVYAGIIVFALLWGYVFVAIKRGLKAVEA